MSSPAPSWWQQYLPLILAGAGAGTSLIGSKMASNQQNRANGINQQNSQQAFQVSEDERRKKDALTQLFLPIIMNSLGMKNRAQYQQGLSAFGGGAVAPPQANGPTGGGGGGGSIVPMQGISQMGSLTDPYASNNFGNRADGPRQLLRM